jgi:hypothetical protein
MALACLSGAAYYWFGPRVGLFVFIMLTFVGVTLFFASKRQFGYAETIAAIAIGLVILLLLLPAIQHAPLDYTTGHCRNNLHNLALALQQYQVNNGTFPPAYIADADGKPMHSWRVLLLPYIEGKAIYDQYRFDEPWNGPNNSALAASVKTPWVYECRISAAPGETPYLAVTGLQTIWPGTTTTKTSDIKDGPANTILLVEAHNSGIHWMEPRDLDFTTMPMTVNSPTSLSISSGHRHHEPYANIVLADGKVKQLPNTTSSKSLRAALTISGGEKEKLPVLRLRP